MATKLSKNRNVGKTVKMSEQHAERLERVCERLDISVNAYMLQAITRQVIEDEGKIATSDMPKAMERQIENLFLHLLNAEGVDTNQVEEIRQRVVGESSDD